MTPLDEQCRMHFHLGRTETSENGVGAIFIVFSMIVEKKEGEAFCFGALCLADTATLLFLRLLFGANRSSQE